MIKQYFTKQKKIARGILQTKIKRQCNAYNAELWWDESFYTSGISDSKTISKKASEAVSKYHYCSVEKLILQHIINKNWNVAGQEVLDIGSGSGHWIDFWRGMGASSITGMDVSLQCYDHLIEKYSGTGMISIYHGMALDVLTNLTNSYDTANAVGVMFHILDDVEWEDTVVSICRKIRPEGRLIVGGHFGFWDKINVQFDDNGLSNKRLRSKGHWLSLLRNQGFDAFYLYRNTSYLHIKYPLPENNVLIAHKHTGK